MRGNFLNSRGFTLIEVLASVVLLAVVISISLSIFPNMFRTNDVNQESLDAVAIAKAALVQVKNNGAPDNPVPIEFAACGTENMCATDNTTYTNYRIEYIVYNTSVTAQIGTNSSVPLDLYTVTIEVYEGNSLRATNYGYVTGDDF